MSTVAERTSQTANLLQQGNLPTNLPGGDIVGISEYLRQEMSRVRQTVLHFLQHKEYADGTEQGLSFHRRPKRGESLPLEIVIRDWGASLNNGRGGRVYKQGDFYTLYMKLYESGLMEHDDDFDQRRP